MNNTDLPPLPSTPVSKPEVCEVVSLYLAVSHDLTAEQKRRVSAHLQICPQCVHEYHLVRRAAQLVNSLEGSEPSARVDVAVMAAIAARTATSTNASLEAVRPVRPTTFNRDNGRNRRRHVPIRSLVAAAAILVVAFVGLMHFVVMPGGSAFAVPAKAWNGYVIYHTQTVVGNNGDQYQVATYHDMSNEMMNVETTMGAKLDVMVVTDGSQTVGMDMKHNVTQMNANAWLTDDSMFDLNQLNANLKSGQATYLGQGQFNGQQVYRIRDNGEILLLDMQYKPVNVLKVANASGTEKPVYDKFQMLKQTQVSGDMWNMTPPTSFKAGQLPAKP